MNTTTPFIPSSSLIHLDDAKKVFFTDEVETHALAGVYRDVQPGEYLAIAGPSGCGKSTLLSILGLLDSPSEGSYVLNGRQVAQLSFAERERIRGDRLTRMRAVTVDDGHVSRGAVP